MLTQNPVDPPSNTHSFRPRETLHVDYHRSHLAPSNRSQRSDCVSRLMLSIITLIVTLSLITFIVWLVIHPHDPEFRLSSFSVSNITFSNSQFTARYDIEITVKNTNKKVDLCIDHVGLSVLYGKSEISKMVLKKSTYVGKMSQERLTAELGRDSVCSTNRVFKDISDDWSKKMVNFSVETSIRIRFERGIWPSKESFMKVSCMNLTVEFLSTKGTGKLMSGGKQCFSHLVD